MLTALQIGTDTALLWSRAALLATTGLRVVSAEDFAQSLEHIWGAPFDLVILCHSLPRPDRGHVLAAVRRRSPSVPILMVAGYGAAGAYKEGVDAVVESEPRKLLQSVQRILHLPHQSGLHQACACAVGRMRVRPEGG